MSDDFFDELDELSSSVEPDSDSPSERGTSAGLQKLASLVEDLNRDLSTKTILNRAMSAAIELTGAERGFLVLGSEDGQWTFRVARNMETGEIVDAESAASHTIIRKVLEGRQPILINDVVGGSDLVKHHSIAKMQVRSIMGAPLIAKGKLLGAAYVDTSRLAGVFDQTSLVLFETFVQLAAVALENARLIEAEQEASSRYRRLQEYLNTVLNSQPYGIVILDPTLRIEYANPQAALLLPDARLKPGVEFTDSGWCESDVQLIFLADLRGFVENGAVRPRTVTKGDCSLAYSFFEVERTDDGRERVGVVIEDITMQKELERKLIESEKQTTINQLAGGIAHEINNSLQPVKGRVELLTLRLQQAGVAIEGGIDKDLETISALSERIEKIAHNLRHLTKPAKPAFEPVELGQLVRATVDLMESTTGTLRGFSRDGSVSPHRLEINIADGLPPTLGDAHGLESAIINMILNSAHAIREKGEGVLKLTAQGNGDHVTVTVEDTGCGMSPDVQARAFEPYFTTRAERGGTGLGMSILQNVAEIHGAELDLWSQEGVGTRISLTFPAMKVEAPAT
ncbi:GAF domain-containing protein [bacterium]|nr:GAF domain-containing protein [bacterium]MBU1984734.1 GAF domain-containing protein [bacterium]